MVKIEEKLWLAEDGKTIVADGDPRAWILAATPGEEVSEERALELGLGAPEEPVEVSPKRAGKKQIESVEEA